jgi:hypothetical protein
MLKNRFLSVAVAITLSGVVAACQNEGIAPVETDGPSLRKESTSSNVGVVAMLGSMNEQLEAMGLDFRVSMVEWVTDVGSGEVGQVVFANDRGNKQLGHHWVPGDPRRLAAGNSITYLVDQSDGAATGGLTNAQTEPAIDQAMNTWEAAQCSNIPLTKVADSGADPDIVDAFLGFGGFGNPFLADLTHSGWLPPGFFDAIVPGGSNFILGVTFTFIFLDPPSGDDIDGDGRLDTALREIYYNNNFPWATNGANFDVETVALHEAGHGLSQGHFGKIFRTLKNGKLHFAPLAVMNAAYSQVQQALTGTDNGGHCSIWAAWPNN